MTLLEKTLETVGETRPAIAVNGDDIWAGYNAKAGALQSFPATINTGSLKLQAVSNSGNYVTTLSNVAMGQATVISLPDPAASTANVILDTGTSQLAVSAAILLDKAAGTELTNAVTINKQSGVITSVALTTAAGATEAITLTNSKVATSSVVLVSNMGGTNTTAGVLIQATAAAGSSVITITNNNASAALNGTVIIGFAVF